MSAVRSYSPKMSTLYTDDLGTDLDRRYAAMESEKRRLYSTPISSSPPTFQPGKDCLFDELRVCKQNASMSEQNKALRRRLRLLSANSTLRAANMVAELVTWIDDYTEGGEYQLSL